MTLIEAAERRRRLDPNGEPPEVTALISEHRDLAERLARRYADRGNTADVRQVADIALLLAARRYDPDTGPFERYAAVTITGELKKHLRRTGWNAHVPRRVQEDALKVQATIDQLTAELRRAPKISEIAAIGDLGSDRVEEALRAHSTRYAATPKSIAGRDAGGDVHQNLDEHLQVRDAVRRLCETDRRLVVLTFEQGLSQREVARRVGLSQSQVQRRMMSILAVLRDRLDPAVRLDDPRWRPPAAATTCGARDAP